MRANKATRREFLVGLGGAALGISLSGVTGLLTAHSQEKPSVPELPWPYVKLDPVAAAERAYEAYYKGGCMFGVFEGIVGELRAKVGAPFTALPTQFAIYGKAGVAGWGTLCGALNGAAAAIYLVTSPADGDRIIDEIYSWYCQRSLPDYKPKSPKFPIAPSVSGSPLCHVSVTRWCEATGFKALSPERSERCAWLTASVAKYTVEQLNKYFDKAFAVAHPIPKDVTSCLACHGKGGVKENVHMSKAVSCTQCHFSLGTKHP